MSFQSTIILHILHFQIINNIYKKRDKESVEFIDEDYEEMSPVEKIIDISEKNPGSFSETDLVSHFLTLYNAVSTHDLLKNVYKTKTKFSERRYNVHSSSFYLLNVRNTPEVSGN